MRSRRWPIRAFLAVGAMAVAGCVTEADRPAGDSKDTLGGALPFERLPGVFTPFIPNVSGDSINGIPSNTNDNGDDNGNDNGAGNDNTNDNGAGNMNDNGDDNGNDDGAGGDICPDGTYRVSADLESGDTKGHMQYRELPGGCTRFRARIDDAAPGTYEVAINNVVVGHIVTDSRGRGELELDTEDGDFPAGFPRVEIGDAGDIGGFLAGTFGLDCPTVAQSCGNANANDNGDVDDNANDNGAGNMNDNGATNTNDNGA